MKKIYLLTCAVLIGAWSMAQVSVTFRVDMNGQTVSPNGVHVAGDWQAAAGFASDWNPGISQMTDANMDGIYELSVTLPPGDYRYKYINGNAWGSDENQIPLVVAAGGNRFFAITQWHGTVNSDVPPTNPNGVFVLPAVQFNQAAPSGLVPARLEIDMANETVSEQGVHVAGDLILANGNAWTPPYGTCSNVASTRYAYVAYTTPGTYSYKFINGDSWAEPNESIAGSCSDGSSNRQIVVGASGATMTLSCYGSCDPCTDPTVVTLKVDMSNVGCSNPLGAHIAGEFNGWSGQPMTDEGNGIYSISLNLDPGTYNFKFQDGPGGWEGSINGACAEPGGGNRSVVVEGASVTYGPFCFGLCTADCETVPDLSTITFRVDMNNEVVSPEGVYMIGSFTSPAWQAGAIELSDSDADGIYEATTEVCGTVSFEYKFVNGDVNDASNEEFHGFPDQLPCNVSNNQGGWNRVHIRQGGIEILAVAPFSACALVNTNSVELGAVRIYPNPSTGLSFIEVENPNGYTLRMGILDITGKLVRAQALINNSRMEINTSNLGPGMYFLQIVNERSERAVYKLMVQ